MRKHKWSAGIEQQCKQGCGWTRRNRANAEGEATSVKEYRHSGASDAETEEPQFHTMDRVPVCGSTP